MLPRRTCEYDLDTVGVATGSADVQRPYSLWTAAANRQLRAALGVHHVAVRVQAGARHGGAADAARPVEVDECQLDSLTALRFQDPRVAVARRTARL